MTSLADTVRELAKLVQYRYYLELYWSGHAQLTVVARPFHKIPAPGEEFFINFVAVKYLQLPTYWENAPFQLATIEDSKQLMQQVGLEIINDNIPKLFYVQLPNTKIYVLCWSVELSTTKPLHMRDSM